MIDVKELRLGNLVKSPIIEYGAINIVGLNAINSGNHKYEPIPLTEEWLIKLGFWSKYKSTHKQWCTKGICIQQAGDTDDEGNEIPTKQEFTYDFKIDIKYVHTLQNLYFALTQKELGGE